MIFRDAIINPTLLSFDENELLNAWAKTVPGFIRDGCANPEKYANAPLKLLFVLKEVNGGKDWDLRDFMNDGCRPQTWNVVSRWIEGLFNLEKDYSWNEINANNDQRRKTFIPQVCAVNVKKTSGTDVANSKIIQKSAEDNKKYLRKQLQLYQSDIVVLCGTEKQYLTATDEKPNWEMTKRGIWYYIDSNGTIVISYSHPEARTKECFLYYGLIDAVKEIISNN